MRIIYPNPNPLPGNDPAAIQVIQSAAAMGKFAEIHLIAHNGYSDKSNIDYTNYDSLRKSIGDYFGVSLPDTVYIHLLPPSVLNIGPIRIRSTSLFHKRITHCSSRINDEFGKPDAILSRNLKLGMWLMKKRHMLDCDMIYEVHDIALLRIEDKIHAGYKPRTGEVKKIMRMEGNVYSQADGLIFTTHAMEQMARAHYNIADKVLVAPNGVDLPDINLKAPGADSIPDSQVLYIGSLHHWKGVDILIKAMKYLDDISLMIVGGKPSDIEKNRLLAKSCGVSGRVAFAGYVSPASRFEWISRTDVCVLPLRHSNMGDYLTSPLKLFEYMGCNKPIIASDLPAIREIITDSVNGLLCEPENPKALAESISRILKDPVLAERISGQARKDVQMYTWKNRAESIIGFIESLRN